MIKDNEILVDLLKFILSLFINKVEFSPSLAQKLGVFNFESIKPLISVLSMFRNEIFNESNMQSMVNSLSNVLGESKQQIGAIMGASASKYLSNNGKVMVYNNF